MGEGRQRYIREGKGQQAQVRPHTTTEMFSSTLYYFENTHRNKHELKYHELKVLFICSNLVLGLVLDKKNCSASVSKT